MTNQSVSITNGTAGIEIIIRRMDPPPVARPAEAQAEPLDRLEQRPMWPAIPPVLPSAWNGLGSGLVIWTERPGRTHGRSK